MRLQSVTINGYKNLKNVNVEFDSDSPVTVILGKNGAGKSNLFEALILIFEALQRLQPTDFEYELLFICRGLPIEIICNPSSTKSKLRIFNLRDGSMENREQIPLSKLAAAHSDIFSSLLPEFIFGYYSGSCRRLQNTFDRYQKKYLESLRENKTPVSISRRFLFGHLDYSYLVLLALFAHNCRENGKSQILDELEIEGLKNISLVVRSPKWFDFNTHDPKSMGLKGVLREFIEELRKHAHSKQPSDTWGKELKEELHFDSEGLSELARFALSRDTNLFNLLLTGKEEEVLSDLSFKIELRNKDNIDIEDLSEGEKQLLLVLGMLSFSDHEESLFLLDEPDTHLNPTWSIKYLRMLEEELGRKPKANIIMATHDPLVFSGLSKEEVRILDRKPGEGVISVVAPLTDPKGMGVGAILTSELYGLRTTLDLETQDLLDRRRRLTYKQTPLSSEEETELNRINTLIERLGFSNSVRDPLYELFSRTWTEREDLAWQDEPSLTPAQLKQRDKLAGEIIDQILKKEGLME